MAEKDTINKLLDELPEFYNKSEDSNNYQVIKSFSDELDEEKVQNTKLMEDVQIDTSSSTSLDDLGKMFRLLRKSDETDENFRARIKAYWPGFSGGGTKDAFVSTLNRITEVPEEDIEITEISPMRVRVKIRVVPSGG